MAKFYFTYGSEGQPFFGGWTEVEAPDMHAACCAFRAIHPDKTEGLLNCCGIYAEEDFKKTCMAGPNGNIHRFCHEKISLHCEYPDPNKFYNDLLSEQQEQM